MDYRETGAVAAGLWFRGWSSESAEFHAVTLFPEAAPYEPGAFYRRELPCLLDVLVRGVKADVVIVDGYVWLGKGAKGLGAHLYDAIGGIVVGVAKTRFASATDAIEVRRARANHLCSSRPSAWRWKKRPCGPPRCRAPTGSRRC